MERFRETGLLGFSENEIWKLVLNLICLLMFIRNSRLEKGFLSYPLHSLRERRTEKAPEIICGSALVSLLIIIIGGPLLLDQAGLLCGSGPHVDFSRVCPSLMLPFPAPTLHSKISAKPLHFFRRQRAE